MLGIDNSEVLTKKVADYAAPKLVNDLYERGSTSAERIKNKLHIGIDKYVARTLARCSYIKTLIHRDDPVYIGDIYVNQTIQIGRHHVNDEEVIRLVNEGGRYVIVGTAGSGKSLLLKYSFVQLVREQDKLPIYFELRNLNDYADSPGILQKALVDHLGEYMDGFSNTRLDHGIRQNMFYLFLDGLDEVSSHLIDRVDREILRISYKYPQLPIIVASRPDDKFRSWQQFRVCRFAGLDFSQVLLLLDRTKSDESFKFNFRKSLENGLYESHKSFLENPLLSTMLILLYDQVGEVPNKMHVFYDRAYEVLMREHDSTKEGFVRKLETGLELDEFKEFCACFCALSFYHGDYTFSESEMRRYIKRALEAKGYKEDTCSWEKFKIDLTKSSSIMQVEGLDYVFVHRSFQEYFMALFLAYFEDVDIKEVILSIQPNLFNSSVLEMAFEMNEAKMEAKFLLPTLRDIERIIDQVDVYQNPAQILSLFFNSVTLDRTVDGSPNILYGIPMRNDNYMIVHRVYKDLYKKYWEKRVPISEDAFVHDIHVLTGTTEDELASIPLEANIEVDESNFDDTVKKTYIVHEIADIAGEVKTVRKGLEDKRKKEEKVMQKFFEI